MVQMRSLVQQLNKTKHVMEPSQAMKWVTLAPVHGYQGNAMAITTVDMYTSLKKVLIRNFHFVKLKYGDKKVSQQRVFSVS